MNRAGRDAAFSITTITTVCVEVVNDVGLPAVTWHYHTACTIDEHRPAFAAAANDLCNPATHSICCVAFLGSNAGR